MQQLSKSQRTQIKAALEISGIGRGRTTYDVRHADRSLSDWLATAALALRPPSLWPSYEAETVDFGEAKFFRSGRHPGYHCFVETTVCASFLQQHLL